MILDLSVSIFFHLSICFFFRPSDPPLFVSLTFHNFNYPCFPVFVYPSLCPFIHIFLRLNDAPFNPTSTTPSSYKPVALSFRFSILPTLRLTAPPFNRHSFPASICSSAALILFLSVHSLFRLLVARCSGLSPATSCHPFVQLLLPSFFFCSFAIASPFSHLQTNGSPSFHVSVPSRSRLSIPSFTVIIIS